MAHKELTVEVGPIAHGGHCVARHEGRVIFVRHALPGELVRVRVREADDAAKFWRADTVEVVRASPDRVEHFWTEADALLAARRKELPVGGAEYGHIRLAAQRRLKAYVLAEQLHRLAGVDLDVVVEAADDDDAGLAWRTRASFAVTPSGRLGMHAHRSDVVLPIEDLPLATDAVNDLRLWETDFAGISRIEVAAPANGSKPLVLLVPEQGSSPKSAGRVLHNVLVQLHPDASVASWEPESARIERLRGRAWVAETAAGHEYRISGEGFWQIHRNAPDVLVRAVETFLDDGGFLSAGYRVADLYAGAGLFSAPLAAAVGPSGSVLSVEGSPGTSRDARKNLHEQGQVEIIQGRVERVLRDHPHSFDAVVLDPPRAGAGKAVVEQLMASRARAIAYVSCDPASFARDLGYFRSGGWQLSGLRAFDLYPNTHHLETVALLTPVLTGRITL
jgi:tRNA/tmRNA/rRNA uracil-C5-methylase (TrmA/RlmC/RlmD family)